MTGFDPSKPYRPTGCRFLQKASDDKYECSIKTGKISWEKLSENVKNYYLTQCLPYPDPDDPAHCPPVHQLPKRCGFRIVEAE